MHLTAVPGGLKVGHVKKGQMTSSVKATTVLIRSKSMCLCLWRMRVRNSWNKSGQTQTGMVSAHTHKVISTDRDSSILKLSEKGVWLLIQPEPCTWWFPLMWLTEETLWRKLHMSCCWDESWGMTVTANSEFLFLLCGDWTHGALLGHISVILAWRNRKATCYSLLFWILYWSNWYEWMVLNSLCVFW
jgi:hypothetical protein